MRFIILICVLCSSASAQEWRFRVEPIKREIITVQPATPNASQRDPEYYVVFFTSPTCGPCKAFKSSSKFTRLKERFWVEEVCTVKHPKWLSMQDGRKSPKVERLPTFWLVRFSDREVMGEPVVGAVDVEWMLTLAERARAAMPRTPDEEAAAKHLLEVHGINADGMTMQQMEAAHDAAHGGEGYHFPGMKSQ